MAPGSRCGTTEEAEVEALLDRYFEAYPEQVAASPDPTAWLHPFLLNSPDPPSKKKKRNSKKANVDRQSGQKY